MSSLTVADSNAYSYIAQNCVLEDELMMGFRETASAQGIPPANVSPMEGKILGFLVRLGQAKRIIEFGTLFGYSAIYMARGASKGAHVFTIEHNPIHLAIAQENIRKAGLAECITVIHGEAKDLLGKLSRTGPYDFCFIDADWIGYPDYIAWATQHVRVGGVVAIHNVFFFGTISQTEKELRVMMSSNTDEAPRALSDYLERSIVDESQFFEAHRQIRQGINIILSNQQFESMVLPFSDGLLLCQRVS